MKDVKFIDISNCQLFGHCWVCGEQFEVTPEEMSGFLAGEAHPLCIRHNPEAEYRPAIRVVKTE